MANKVTRYQAADGELFETEKQANIYDDFTSLMEYLDEHRLRKDIRGKSVIKWVAERAPRIHMTLLPEEKNGD